VRYILAANQGDSESFTLKIEVIHSSKVSDKEPHGIIISQKTAFFIVTAVKTPNLMSLYLVPVK
jgi:hypothetical protein